MLGFGGLVDELVVDPAPAVAGDFMAGLLHGRGGLAVAFECHGHGEHRHRYLALAKHPQQAPEPGPAAVLVDGLHAEVAHALVRPGADDFRQEGLGCGVPVQHAVLTAFLVVQHDLQCQSRPARPLGIGGLGPVAPQVAWIRPGHARGPRPKTVVKSIGCWVRSRLSLFSQLSRCASMSAMARASSPSAMASITARCSSTEQGDLPGAS